MVGRGPLLSSLWIRKPLVELTGRRLHQVHGAERGSPWGRGKPRLYGEAGREEGRTEATLWVPLLEILRAWDERKGDQ